MTPLTYKGYFGSIEFDQAERLFFGKLASIRALVCYEAKDADGLVRAFEEAVDDYRDQCREEGIRPEKPLTTGPGRGFNRDSPDAACR